MRIAVVTPYVKRLQGNRGPFSDVRALASAHDVTLYAHTIYAPLVAEVERAVAPARLRYLRTSSSPAFRNRDLLVLQLVRGRDRALAKLILDDHHHARFEAVIVIANEGHWLGEYLRRSGPVDPPVTVVCATDLIDHVFLLGYERPGALARRLVSFLHPVLHRIEESRLRAFDYVVVNSEWTGELLRYLYGIQPDLNIAAVDVGVFQPPSPSRPPPGSYVALPTVSLDASTQALALDLHRRGIPFVAFGPHPVAGIPDRGFVTDAELVMLLGQAAATLFLFDYEALGLLPFESLATGTPVITLPKGGPYSELRSNPFVSFGTDADSLFVACRRWLGNTKSAESIADCRASVLRYDPARVAEQIVELLVRRKVGSRSSSAHPRPATAAGVTQH